MQVDHKQFPAIVLAGERPGGNRLAAHLKLPLGVLAPLGEKTLIEHVVSALSKSRYIDEGLIVGSQSTITATLGDFDAWCRRQNFHWLDPSAGPSASALEGARALAQYPLLLTAADHALLTSEIIDSFCEQALRSRTDFVAALVPYSEVIAHYPQTRRTRLRFRKAIYCGANLFMIRSPKGLNVLRFWQTVERDRKRPWRLSRRLGNMYLLRYLAGLLSVEQGFARLSAISDARVSWIELKHARAAIDVDTIDDWTLAREILND